MVAEQEANAKTCASLVLRMNAEECGMEGSSGGTQFRWDFARFGEVCVRPPVERTRNWRRRGEVSGQWETICPQRMKTW